MSGECINDMSVKESSMKEMVTSIILLGMKQLYLAGTHIEPCSMPYHARMHIEPCNTPLSTMNRSSHQYCIELSTAPKGIVLTTGQPHYNAIFGVHRNRPCYK